MGWLKARLGEDGTYAGLAVLCVVVALLASTTGADWLVLPAVIGAAACGALAIGIPQKIRDRW